MTDTTFQLQAADAALARRFADSCYDDKIDPPAREGMLRLVELGLLTEYQPGKFSETPELKKLGY
jgi:hypothetical protein